jgi:dihydroxy-acid dehydratase
MEAYNGGPIGAIRNGDIIDIDIPRRRLNVRLSDEEIGKRLKTVAIPERDLTALLAQYRDKFNGIYCYGR